MKVTRSQLSDICGVSEHCLRVYLARGEFVSAETTYKNVYDMDDELIQHLKELIRMRRGHRHENAILR